MNRSAFTKLAIATAALVLASAVWLSPVGAFVAVILMISVVGLPLAFLLGLVPPVALLFALATFFAWPMRRFGRAGIALAFLPAAGVMVSAPLLLNRAAEAEAGRLIADDRQPALPHFTGRSLAVFVRPRLSDECRDFCQRALLSGAVDRFIIARPARWPEPDPSAQGKAYRLERRGQCEAVRLRDGAAEYPVARGAPPAAPAMRLAIAGGNCLVEEPALAGEADGALFLGETVEDRSDFSSLDPFHVPMRALRLSWYSRKDGRLVEEWRRTAVEYATLATPLAPALLGGSELRMYAGLMRTRRKAGAEREAIDADALLAELGFDLQLDGENTGEARVEALQSALRGPAGLSEAQQALAGDVFAALDARDTDAAAIERAIALLGDRRVAIPDRVGLLVAAAYRAGGEMQERALKAYFDRLDELVRSPQEGRDKTRAAALRRMSWAAARIPDADFARRWPRLRVVTGDAEAVAAFGDEIRRAHLAGEAAHGDLLALIDAGAPGDRNERRRSGGAAAARYPALHAICRMGAGASMLLPELERRMADGVLPLTQSNEWEVAASAILALGGDPRIVRTHARPHRSVKDPAPAIEAAIERMRKRGRCF